MSSFVNNTARLLPIRLMRRGKFSTWVLGVWDNTTEVAWLDYLCETEFPWRNVLELDMLMYPDHLWNWLSFGHSLLIFLILAAFWLNERCQIGRFQAIIENAWEEWAEICHAYVSWPPSELIRIGSWHVDFPNLFIYTLWFCANLTGLWQWRGDTTIRSTDLLINLYHVISDKMKTANISMWRFSSYRAGAYLTAVQSDLSSFI